LHSEEARAPAAVLSCVNGESLAGGKPKAAYSKRQSLSSAVAAANDPWLSASCPLTKPRCDHSAYAFAMIDFRREMEISLCRGNIEWAA
jgi:hypothetical protein